MSWFNGTGGSYTFYFNAAPPPPRLIRIKIVVDGEAFESLVTTEEMGFLRDRSRQIREEEARQQQARFGQYRAANPRPQSSIEQELCQLAGVEYPTHLTQKQLFRKAQRRCHPDTGGSHELFVQLDKLKIYLDID